ncbi:hypothetical protein NDU88_001997 [Pleurodeles waltl]|uniref:Androgen receptor n=1 Tax=Pleurodeles waltl TaxID=8319 RepID=A0AAV7PAD3_PLEWA|nr:hypothetical protein NDU88_001997 [Pleurodeles waltl]
MAWVAGERALAFTTEELDKLMDGVLPLYAKLHGRPEIQVSQHPSKEGTLACHCQGGADPGGFQPVDYTLQEGVGGPAALGEEDLRGPAGELLPTRKVCPSGPDPPTTPHYGSGVSGPDGRLKAAQQTQGASSGEGAVALASGDLAAHGSMKAETSYAKGTSGLEGEGSTTGEATTT